MKISKQLIYMAAAGLVLLSLNGVFIYNLVSMTTEDARIINRAGTVRGSIQRAVKLALAHLPAGDAIRAADEALADVRDHGKTLLARFMHGEMLHGDLAQLERKWGHLKGQIRSLGPGASDSFVREVLSESERIWDTADRAVFSAQRLAETTGRYYLAVMGMVAINIILLLLIIFIVKRFVADRMEYLAPYDSLTGAFNRPSFVTLLRKSLDAARRYGYDVALVIIDIDHFKKVNDTKGHAAGDAVLHEIADIVLGTIRTSDVFGRLGGEEFGILAPQSRLQNARVLADKICKAVQSGTRENGNEVTLSAGVAEARAGEGIEPLMARADAALYMAKANGRNRVEIAE